MMALACCANAARAAFLDGAPVASLDNDAGTTLVVRTLDAAAFSSQRYAYSIPGNRPVQAIGIHRSSAGGAQADVVTVAVGDGTLVRIPEGSFGSGAGASTQTLRVSNSADAFDVACDQRTAMAVGTSSATPIALVDLVTGSENATLGYTGKLGRAVAIAEDATQALVVLDDAGTSAGIVRRVLIAPGRLTDAGEFVAYGASLISRVLFAPGNRYGVAIVGSSTSDLVSFTVPGLVPRSAVRLGGGAGNAVAFGAAGDRIYVRSGRGDVKDVVEAFTFDPATGEIGQVPLWRSDAIGGFHGNVYQSPLAISEDGRHLVAGDQDLGGHSASPHLSAIDVVTGGIASTVALGPGARPAAVATRRACKASPSTQVAVEYRHATFDHYFATSLADEVSKLDNGTFAGWARTGKQFNVYASGTTGTTPTCRFFSTAFGSKSSHFYATSASECATVKANPNWQFEGEVFNTSAVAADGTCASPLLPLFRLYNNGQGGAPNHRYTTEAAVRTQMIGAGWVPEGAGQGVVACVPP
ncbi:MAG: hypothetical protein U1F41_14545 [Burkholderiales bacterium]